MPRVYPSLALPIPALRAIEKSYRDDPELLDAAECPYDQETIAYVKRFLRIEGKEGKEGKAFRDAESTGDRVADTLKGIMEDLDVLRVRIQSEGVESAVVNTYFRLASSLTEKLISLEERRYSSAAAQAFMTGVVEILEQEVPEDVASAVMKRVQEFLDQ